MRNCRKWVTGISAALLLGTLAGCHNGSNTNVAINDPDPNPTACPAWGCGGPPRYFPLPDPTPLPTPTPTFTVCPAWGCGPAPVWPVGVADANVGSTKDVDLQRADLQAQDLNSRAEAFANQFQMDFQNALKLTQLSDEVRAMTANGQSMTAADQNAVAASAFAIAGVRPDEVANAVTKSLAGDNTAEDALLAKAAANLGMPTTALRDQLLPAIGIKP